jgi:hypothetical protein
MTNASTPQRSFNDLLQTVPRALLVRLNPQLQAGLVHLRTNETERQAWALGKFVALSYGELLELIEQIEPDESPERTGQRVADRVAEAGRDNLATIEALTAPYAASMPAWYPARLLQGWAKTQAGQRATPQTAVHPAAVYLKENATQLAAGDDASHSLRERSLRLQVPVRIDGCPITVGLVTRVDDLAQRLWERTDAKTLEQAVEAVSAALGPSRSEAVMQFVARCAALTLTAEQARQFEYPPEEWAALIAELLGRYGLNAEPIEQALGVVLAQRKVALQIRAVTRALPDKLSDLYPLARRLQRRLKLVVGPTNSGKTYQAIERIKTAGSAVYLGPLRLLALEVRDRLEDEGAPCSLVTGELMQVRAGARCAACTIEMLDFETEFEVAVIDEVQMLADPQRGSAWVQAILGAPAREVWLLGSPEAQDAVEALARYLDEPLEVIHTRRLSELSVHRKATALADVPPQSAVVAFSRQDVLDIAAELQEKRRRTCAVIYGALSPEVRKAQAARFRSGEADVVVATDAIAMGLNLPVKAIYFSTASKWNGHADEPIPHDLVWQIAGRAGRFGHHEKGSVGGLDRETLDFVAKSLSTRPEPVAQFYRHSATWPLVQEVAKHLKTGSLLTILSVFSKDLQLSEDQRFKPGIPAEQMKLAVLLDRYTLALRERFVLSHAPVPFKKDLVAPEFVSFVLAVSQRKPLALDELGRYHAQANEHVHEPAEYAVKMMTLYCWLHYRFPDVFPDMDAALVQIEALNAIITTHLRRTNIRTCAGCGTRLFRKNPFPRCSSCFDKSRRSRPGQYERRR